MRNKKKKSNQMPNFNYLDYLVVWVQRKKTPRNRVIKEAFQKDFCKCSCIYFCFYTVHCHCNRPGIFKCLFVQVTVLTGFDHSHCRVDIT